MSGGKVVSLACQIAVGRSRSLQLKECGPLGAAHFYGVRSIQLLESQMGARSDDHR